MKFLVDESLSHRVAAALNEAGHDAIHAGDADLLGAMDEPVLTHAAEAQRVLLTADTDFGELLALTGATAVPKKVRDELGLREGDRVLFRVVDGRAVLARTPDLLDLAGSVPVPPDVRDLEWSEVRARAQEAQAARSR